MKNLTIITLLAGAITFGLFAFMAFLISGEQVKLAPPLEHIPINIVQLPEEKPAQVKVRPIFQAPTPPPPMPRTSMPPEVSELDTTLGYNPIALKTMGNNVKSLSLAGQTDSDARPVVRVNPKYPLTAARNGIEGWVVLTFNINTIGEVVDIAVIDSQPKRIFNKAARQALTKWKYRAKKVDGKAVAQQNLTVQLDFTMAQSS